MIGEGIKTKGIDHNRHGFKKGLIGEVTRVEMITNLITKVEMRDQDQTVSWIKSHLEIGIKAIKAIKVVKVLVLVDHLFLTIKTHNATTATTTMTGPLLVGKVLHQDHLVLHLNKTGDPLIARNGGLVWEMNLEKNQNHHLVLALHLTCGANKEKMQITCHRSQHLHLIMVHHLPGVIRAMTIHSNHLHGTKGLRHKWVVHHRNRLVQHQHQLVILGVSLVIKGIKCLTHLLINQIGIKDQMIISGASHHRTWLHRLENLHMEMPIILPPAILGDHQ